MMVNASHSVYSSVDGRFRLHLQPGYSPSVIPGVNDDMKREHLHYDAPLEAGLIVMDDSVHIGVNIAHINHHPRDYLSYPPTGNNYCYQWDFQRLSDCRYTGGNVVQLPIWLRIGNIPNLCIKIIRGSLIDCRLPAYCGIANYRTVYSNWYRSNIILCYGTGPYVLAKDTIQPGTPPPDGWLIVLFMHNVEVTCKIKGSSLTHVTLKSLKSRFMLAVSASKHTYTFDASYMDRFVGYVFSNDTWLSPNVFESPTDGSWCAPEVPANQIYYDYAGNIEVPWCYYGGPVSDWGLQCTQDGKYMFNSTHVVRIGDRCRASLEATPVLVTRCMARYQSLSAIVTTLSELVAVWSDMLLIIVKYLLEFITLMISSYIEIFTKLNDTYRLVEYIILFVTAIIYLRLDWQTTLICLLPVFYILPIHRYL